MENIFGFIKMANHLQVNDILMELMKRYKELNPEYEVYLFTLPSEDGNERDLQLEQAITMIRNHM